MFGNKKVIVGVCGSIAAYKAAMLVRLLVKAGAEVRVVMTPDAANFITPLTLSTLSRNPVGVDFFNQEDGTWYNHVELGLWADLLLIAPATANTLAKFSNGLCDNVLTAVYLSARCPVFFAPAMDLDMWKHAATQANISRLQSYGNTLIQPGSGELASGLHGEGRMAEPEEIMNQLEASLKKKLPLAGKKALVSAGPTYEAIDPVRFIGNHSSGKMGYALAEELYRQGATVVLVSGPVALTSIPGIELIAVLSAEEMLHAMLDRARDSDIVVMSAAVADYRPETVAEKKIKKEDGWKTIELVKTTDILELLGLQKPPEQILVGFALETDHEVENAIKKINRKNLDFIVLNSLKDEGAGFKADTNKVTMITKTLEKEEFLLKSKKEVAADIANKIIQLLDHA